MVVEDDHVCNDWDDFEDWRGDEPGEPEMGEKVGEIPRLPFTRWGDPGLGAKAYTGAMVALFLPPADAQALAMDLGEGSLPADELHITLLFLGDSTELENREAAEQAVADLAKSLQPLKGKIGGYGIFTGGKDGDVVYLSFDAAEMPAFREAVVQRLAAAGFEQSGEHGFIPHITLAYLQEGQEVPALEIDNRAIRFDEIALAWGGERSTFPLGGRGQKEAEAMPYEKRQQGDQWCVFKEGAEEPMKCYDSEKKADAYLTALRINVEAREKAASEAAEKAAILSVRAKDVMDELGLDSKDVEGILREYLLQRAATTEVGQITKERGQGQGQDGERQGDGGSSSCECPECGKEFSHERGTPCNEKKCPECDVPLVGSNGESEDEEEEGSEEMGEKDIPNPEQRGVKAGRRLNRSMKDRIRDAFDTLKEVLGWAEYEDQEPDGALASFFKMDTEHQSGMAVKAVNGDPWMFTYTTNAFKDRQREIFSTKCLEQYVTEAEAKGDRGTYDLWHIKGTDFADVQWQGVIGRFLVEAGPFHDTPIGRAAKAFFTKHPTGHPRYAPEGWGSSPEFRYLPEERKSGTYNWIWIVRRAVLPRAAAANVWTRGTEVSAMALTKQQKELGAEILGEELLQQVIQEAESRTKELEEAGIAHKAADVETDADADQDLDEELEEEGVDDDEPEEDEDDELESESESESEGKAETAQVEVDVKAIAEQLASIFEVKLDPMTELAEQVQTLAQDVKALRSELQAVKGKEAVKSQVETPRFVLNLTKKASQAEETEVEDDDPLLKMKPVERQVNVSGAAHFFGKS